MQRDHQNHLLHQMATLDESAQANLAKQIVLETTKTSADVMPTARHLIGTNVSKLSYNSGQRDKAHQMPTLTRLAVTPNLESCIRPKVIKLPQALQLYKYQSSLPDQAAILWDATPVALLLPKTSPRHSSKMCSASAISASLTVSGGRNRTVSLAPANPHQRLFPRWHFRN